MTAERFPGGLRIGSVPYLNGRPLVWGIESRVEFAVPSELADRFSAGLVDVALLPVFEAFRLGGGQAVDGISISAAGPVRSVIVVHRRALEATPEIVLDPSSRTSAGLLNILVSGFWRIGASVVSHAADPEAARLIIGDPALDFQRSRPAGWMVTDLAGEWKRWTGLPFVFAVWMIRSGVAGTRALAEELRRVAAEGLASRGVIAAATADPAGTLHYLTENIRYSLGKTEKAALERYHSLLVESGQIPEASRVPVFI